MTAENGLLAGFFPAPIADNRIFIPGKLTRFIRADKLQGYYAGMHGYRMITLYPRAMFRPDVTYEISRGESGAPLILSDEDLKHLGETPEGLAVVCGIGSYIELWGADQWCKYQEMEIELNEKDARSKAYARALFVESVQKAKEGKSIA